MKKSIIVVCIILCICFLCGAVAYAGLSQSDAHIAGEAYKDAKSSDQAELQATDVIAEYGSHKITKGTIDYYRNMQSLGYGGDSTNSIVDDRTIANQLILNIILEEEARRLGLAATDDEVEEMFKAVLLSYEIPDGKAFIDDYCKGAGITVQEYFKLVLEQLPETITRQKLKDEIGRNYCKENEIEFTKVNQPREMKDYVNQQLDDLFESRKAQIVYHSPNHEVE